MAAVARMLNMVEETGSWPTEWLDTYVSMLPKSTGGTRPRDQRPITVLDVVYRIWSKGIVMVLSPVLQRDFLGQAAMGFCAQSGTSRSASIHCSGGQFLGCFVRAGCIPRWCNASRRSTGTYAAASATAMWTGAAGVLRIGWRKAAPPAPTC